ncbi:MAG TPA: hypothetical protein VMG12_02735, partial [Polyangiaceae bacterium]|nr:hypothetical protein [Polyangiaceae bacterium]
DGSTYFAGGRSTLLVRRDGVFERMSPPGLAPDTLFGVWAAAADDVYAVGSRAGRNGFIWHHDGRSWNELPLPASLPLDDNRDVPGFFKVWGESPADVWVVGDGGVVLRGNADEGFRVIATDTDERLFTVHGAAGEVVMVGGSGNGLALEVEGDTLVPATPPGASLLQGVHVSTSGAVWAVGLGGNVYTRAVGTEWQAALPDTPVQSLHSVWVDPGGGVWTVGGNVLSDSLDGGVALHASSKASVRAYRAPASVEPGAPVCPRAEVDPAPGASVARRWNEQLLGAIRRDLPRPMVHARTLFHLSIALWDAWAAYDDRALGYLSADKASADDVDAARREAISYAAYRLLDDRFASATGGALSRACFAAQLRALGYDPLDAEPSGDTPRALGNRIGRAVRDGFVLDGSNQAADYADPEGFEVDNAPLNPDLPGTFVADPNLWQPLLLSRAESLNAIRLGSGVQSFLGAHWGRVGPFALARPAPDAPYVDVADSLLVSDTEQLAAVVEVIARSGRLGIADGERWPVSAGRSAEPSSDASTAPVFNPITGAPYEVRSPLRGDYARALVEYWTNGPRDETPPGLWNALANAVSDDARSQRLLFGAGAPLDALAWDVHVYLALNAALHDAAIATWELKRRYPSARPITRVRHLAEIGQHSDPTLAAYDPDGLPLLPGSIELISEASSARGERHAHLARHIGELALFVWPGEPGDREQRASEPAWIRAKDWVPYQPHAVVTPAYPGFVSEQAAFGHAAAAVLAALTGSDYFPGGLAGARVERLRFERGPSEPVELEWATYTEAADQAGEAGIWSGTQLEPDVGAGRRVGARAAELALERARRLFDGVP